MATRGPQVVLEGRARTVARGGGGRTMRENIAAMEGLVAAGLTPDGTTVDGKTRSGQPAYDHVIAQFPREELAKWEIPAPLLQGLGGTSGNVKDYGAIMDGQSHPLSQFFPSLAAAQVVFPHATSLNDEIDWAAIQACVNALNTAILIPAGTAIINRPVVSTSTTPITLIGQGVNVSWIIQTTAGADGWQHVALQSFQIFGISLRCRGVGGTALRLDFGTVAVSEFTMRDVEIVGDGALTTNYWHDAVNCKNPSVTVIDHIWIIGNNGGPVASIGDALYFTDRSVGSYNVLVRDSRIHYYNRGVVFDSTGATINMQGLVLDWVNYGGLMQFVTVLGTCLELVLTKCQGASYGSVIHAEGATTVTVRDGLFFMQIPGATGDTTKLPQDLFYANNGGNWWVKDNRLIIMPNTAAAYIFNFVNTFIGAIIRDTNMYMTATGSSAVGYVHIDATSLQVIENNTSFGNWNAAWPVWVNDATLPSGGGNVASLQTLTTGGTPTVAQWQTQGTIIGWNYAAGQGRTTFINSRGAGVGGFAWYVTDSAVAATPVEVMSLDATGNFEFYGQGPGALNMVYNAPAGSARTMLFQTAGSNRWNINVSNVAESGGDVGSGFSIGYFTDAGVTKGTALSIDRVTGIVSLTNMAIGSAAGPTWSTGPGVPASTQPRGSLYSRTSGAVGSTLYVSQGGGTWNPIAGV